MKTLIKLLTMIFAAIALTSCTTEIDVSRLDPETISWQKEEQEKLLQEQLKGRSIDNLKGNELYNANLLKYIISMQDYVTVEDSLFISNAIYFPIGETAEIDLNSDGKYETITVTPITEEYSLTNMELTINGLTVSLYLDNPVESYAIIDINTNDAYKQVFLCEEGPSNDPRSYIYTFDGYGIIESGMISGIASPNASDMSGISAIKIDGSGDITFWQRASNLQTWFFKVTYGLDDTMHLYEHVPEQRYYKTDYPVFMMKPLIVFNERDTLSKTLTIKDGQTANISATDNNQWIQVTASDGTQGWAFLENAFGNIYNGDVWNATTDVFYRLLFAD